MNDVVSQRKAPHPPARRPAPTRSARTAAAPHRPAFLERETYDIIFVNSDCRTGDPAAGERHSPGNHPNLQ